MIEGPGEYTVTGTSYAPGITVAPVTGRFDANGGASVAVAITVAQQVPEGYYPVYLTAAVAGSSRYLTVMVDVPGTDVAE
jgi:hypothetical protein